MKKPIKILNTALIKSVREARENVARSNRTGGNVDAARDHLAATLSTAYGSPEAREIANACEAVNGRAAQYTYGASDIINIAIAAEAELEKRGVSIKNRPQCVVTALSAVPTSKSYNRKSRTAIATSITLRRGSSAWYVDRIERAERYTGPGGDEKLTYSVTDAAIADITEKALKGFKKKEEA